MRSGLISAAAILCVALGAYAQTPSKIGVISMQGALVGTKDGQKASQELETKWAPKKKEMDARGAEISQLEDQLRKSGNLMSDDKRNQMTRDIDEKKKRYQRDAQDAQDELNQDQNKVLQSLAQRLYAVVEKYAKDNGYTMIIDVSAQNTPVLYASSGVDITQDIIALYDKTSSNGGPAVVPAVPTKTTPAPKPGTPPGK
ncbi:MAG TPA: OmpH family outer membrane protein [Bryobacteraceae bacterium]|jgi:outer membrane protein|nr:OmpH family outer membrane protein [Bryobacteraceae bacterium]